MITTDALTYLPQMGLVGCAGTKCRNSFALANRFAVEAIVAEKCSIVFFCSAQRVMRQPQACKHQVCDHCGGRFGMVTHLWWGNKFCRRTCKNAYLRGNHHALSGWVISRFSRSRVAPALPRRCGCRARAAVRPFQRSAGRRAVASRRVARLRQEGRHAPYRVVGADRGWDGG